MTTAQDVLKVAQKSIGVKESPSGSDKTVFGEWLFYVHTSLLHQTGDRALTIFLLA